MGVWGGGYVLFEWNIHIEQVDWKFIKLTYLFLIRHNLVDSVTRSSFNSMCLCQFNFSVLFVNSINGDKLPTLYLVYRHILIYIYAPFPMHS